MPPVERRKRYGPKRRPGAARWRPKSVLGWAIAVLIGMSLAGSLVSRLAVATVLPHLPGADVPPSGVEAAGAPLGVPPATTGSTAYVLHPAPDEDQQFVAYDPCRPLHYVVRPDFAPPGTDRLIRESVAAVSAATGLQFVDDGATDEAPSAERESYQPDRYGKRWAPILIVWSTPEESPDLAGRVAGTGGSSSIRIDREPYVYVTGQVHLDAPDLSQTLAGPDGPALVRAVIMHELGHVVGLDHVNDRTQLMHEENSGQLGFGAGDRAGLAVLGTGKCVPRL
ncbi:matrixin family metalloprotease [Pseudarthrobacter sp. NPDC058362]|uniref:matrixin family metalloprotease n=1 Tax=Pseudarthrobacter sp. NPDC058362 TaxID=3346458 RepID=UPI0036482047